MLGALLCGVLAIIVLTNVIYHVANHQIGEELISLLRMIAPVVSGFRTIIYRVVFDRTSLLHLFIA